MRSRLSDASRKSLEGASGVYSAFLLSATMQPNRPQHPQPYHAPYPGTVNNSARAAQAVSAALSNPYGQSYGVQAAYPQASHYAQAYSQYYNGAGPSHVTADGYTISSTYVPGTQYHTPQPARPPVQRAPVHGGGGGQGQPGWYQAGTSRCSKPGCSFTGSKQSVEVHMMDRHLIYPPGWEHRKKRQDWDADPSLKGWDNASSRIASIHSNHMRVENPSLSRERASNSIPQRRSSSGSRSARSGSRPRRTWTTSSARCARLSSGGRYRLTTHPAANGGVLTMAPENEAGMREGGEEPSAEGVEEGAGVGPKTEDGKVGGLQDRPLKTQRRPCSLPRPHRIPCLRQTDIETKRHRPAKTRIQIQTRTACRKSCHRRRRLALWRCRTRIQWKSMRILQKSLAPPRDRSRNLDPNNLVDRSTIRSHNAPLFCAM